MKIRNRIADAVIVAIYVAAVILGIMLAFGVKSTPLTFVETDTTFALSCAEGTITYSAVYVLEARANSCVSDTVFQNGFEGSGPVLPIARRIAP